MKGHRGGWTHALPAVHFRWRGPAPRRRRHQGALTATQAGLITCQVCRRLAEALVPVCPRCGAALHPRRPDSLRRTWALVIAAALLYIPANLLPVMRVTYMGRVQADTILGGVIYFVQTGAWHLATVIFVASVVVPLAKVAILLFLLVSVHRRARWRPEDRTLLYRLMELMGRWSMVDIFVVTLMAALVAFGSLATTEAGPGALPFAGVVLLTMLAAMTFDPRLIWDALETDHA